MTRGGEHEEMTELEMVDEQARGMSELLAANSQGNIEVGILSSYQGIVEIGTTFMISSASQLITYLQTEVAA